MTNLTKEQAREMSTRLKKCAELISDFRNSNAQSLSAEQKAKLDRESAELFNKASDLRIEAASIVFTDLQTSLKHIQDSTKGIEAALKQIDSVSTCISYATKLVVLVGAIATGNAVAIATVSIEIISSLNADNIIAAQELIFLRPVVAIMP